MTRTGFISNVDGPFSAMQALREVLTLLSILPARVSGEVSMLMVNQSGWKLVDEYYKGGGKTVVGRYTP